jgi:hypothetical protein
MHILENDPILTVILDPLFVLVGFGIVLKLRISPKYSWRGQYLCDG